MKYMFMMEYTLRIVDYSLNCITKLFNTGLANADLASDDSDEEMSQELKSEAPSEMESLCIESDEGLNDNFWSTFDLKQEPHCLKLDLNLSCPLIIMPNLSEQTDDLELADRFELDFGTIRITSKLVEETKRWVNHPDKLFRSMAVTV